MEKIEKLLKISSKSKMLTKSIRNAKFETSCKNVQEFMKHK